MPKDLKADFKALKKEVAALIEAQGSDPLPCPSCGQIKMHKHPRPSKKTGGPVFVCLECGHLV